MSYTVNIIYTFSDATTVTDAAGWDVVMNTYFSQTLQDALQIEHDANADRGGTSYAYNSNHVIVTTVWTNNAAHFAYENRSGANASGVRDAVTAMLAAGIAVVTETEGA